MASMGIVKVGHISLDFSRKKTIILGDFNQNIPKQNQPEIVFSSLINLIDGFNLLTANYVNICQYNETNYKKGNTINGNYYLYPNIKVHITKVTGH